MWLTFLSIALNFSRFTSSECSILPWKSLSLPGTICGIANDRFKSYLSDRRQFVSINGFNSDHAMLKHGFPQGSVLGPILFLIYINDLSHAIKYCEVHHFADDTNLLHFNSSAKKLNRLVNLDMKHLSVWLNANKISLNVQKTELVIFKQKRKILDHKIKI